MLLFYLVNLCPVGETHLNVPYYRHCATRAKHCAMRASEQQKAGATVSCREDLATQLDRQILDDILLLLEVFLEDDVYELRLQIIRRLTPRL